MTTIDDTISGVLRLEALATCGWTVVAVGPRNHAVRCHRVPNPRVRGDIALAEAAEP